MPNLLQRDVEALEDASGNTFLLAQQPEQQVLGADVVVLKAAGLVLRQDDDLPRSLREPLEQRKASVAHATAGGLCPPAARDPRLALAERS